MSIMKKIIYLYLFICFYSCKGQELFIDSKNKDVITFEFKKLHQKLINLLEKHYIPDKKKNL